MSRKFGGPQELSAAERVGASQLASACEVCRQGDTVCELKLVAPGVTVTMCVTPQPCLAIWRTLDPLTQVASVLSIAAAERGPE